MENTMCPEVNEDVKGLPRKIKHWLLHFKFGQLEGWAIVNAKSVNMALGIFLRQTRFQGAQIIGLEELRYFGEEEQIVCEGAGGKSQIKNPL